MDLAGDNQHPGPTSHQIAAEEIQLQFQGIDHSVEENLSTELRISVAVNFDP
jgi:hypothetical protein